MGFSFCGPESPLQTTMGDWRILATHRRAECHRNCHRMVCIA